MNKTLIAATAVGIGLAAGMAHATPAGPGSGYHVVDRIPGPDGGWDYLSVDNLNNRVLVAKGAAIISVDLATKAVNPAFATASGSHGAVAVDGGKQVVITNGGANTATFVDAKTGALVATVPTARGPDAVAIDPKTGMVLVMGHASGDVTVIDPRTHAVTGTITVGGTLEGAVADGEGRAFVNVENKGEVAAVDLKTFKTVAHYAMPGCDGPTGIDYDRSGKLLVVACDAVAKFLDAKTGAVIASIPTGPGADGAAIYQKEDLAFISTGGDGALAVISLKGGKPKLLENVPTEKGARTIAIDQQTGRVYLPVAEYGPPAAGARRGAFVPGSFKLLVVGK
jgi:YVTN family beta-propeller protein